jgi:hypothetical protein
MQMNISSHINRIFLLLPCLLTVFTIIAQTNHAISQKHPATPSTVYIADGYMDKLSYLPGDTATVYISAAIFANPYLVYLYSVNDEKVDSVETIIFSQGVTTPKPWMNGFGYQPTFQYVIPTLPSGVYYWDQSRKIFFIVKDPLKNRDITIVYQTNTEAAYNNSGGKSLYDFNSHISPTDTLRSYVVSFQRPLSEWIIVNVRSYCEAFLQWFWKLGYSVQMISDLDLEHYDEIENSKILIVPGHSEYWSRQARLNFDQFVNSGKDAMVLSGNTMWWQVRYKSNNTKLICYKDAAKDTNPDPLLQTINWPDPLLNYPVLNSIGADFVHGAYGMKPVHGWYGYKVTRPGSPLLEGTNLQLNDTIACQSQEYDGTIWADTTGNNFIADTSALGFCKLELIGYDEGKSIYGYGPQKSFGTFVAFQKTMASGKIINTGFTNWCSKNGQEGAIGGFGGKDSLIIKQITLNMVNKLLAGDPVFTTPVTPCTLSAEETPAEPASDISIYPNPSDGRFTVVFEHQPEQHQVEIFNIFGKPILKSTLIGKEHSIDISGQPGGVYLLMISDGRKRVFRKMVVVG